MRCSTFSLAGVLVLVLAPSLGCSNEATPPAGAPASGAGAAAGLPDRDPALAHKLVAEGAVLLDVRSPSEFASRHIDGAVNVPVDQLDERMAEVEKLAGGDAQKPIVVYCAAGGRAAQAKEMLLKAGHTKVTNLGGIGNWDKK